MKSVRNDILSLQRDAESGFSDKNISTWEWSRSTKQISPWDTSLSFIEEITSLL
jgi:hypothetical protein